MKKKSELTLKIKWIDAKKDMDLEDAYQVRREVFILEQKVPEEEEIDEMDFKSHHIYM